MKNTLTLTQFASQCLLLLSRTCNLNIFAYFLLFSLQEQTELTRSLLY